METDHTQKNLAELTYRDFEEGRQVSIHHPNGLFRGIVQEVTLLRKPDQGPGRKEPFALLFECANGTPAIQATVHLAFDRFTLEQVLITPVLGPEKSASTFYEAMFS